MINDHLRAISVAFDDLIILSKNYDDQIFDELYYNRDTELAKFRSFMENIQTSSDNILILGEAGIGKTSFVYKLANDKKTMDEYGIYPIVIDYSKIPPRSVSSSLMYFIKEIFKYFEAMNIGCNGAKEIREDTITINFHVITDHLRDYEKIKPLRHCVVFIDDIDYAEDDWYDLLKYFMPLSISPLISIVLTVRPHLYAAIENYDDRISYFFSRNVKDILLEKLSVENLLSSRLAPFLIEKKENALHRFINRLFSRQSRLSNIIRKYGIKNLDDLSRIEYPFTEKHNNFMSMISNGNIREIFDIAYESLSYILNNSGLEEREENGFNRKVIGKEGVMKIFYDAPKTRYKMLNINANKNRRGNSRDYNVLEAIKIFRINSEQFYQSLQSLSHSRKEVDISLEELNLRNHRLIKPKSFIPKSKKPGYQEYELTEKGNYYLSIADWPEYKERCGDYGKSFIASFEGMRRNR